MLDGRLAKTGEAITDKQRVNIDGNYLPDSPAVVTIMLNKPRGYVCSRRGQGSKTVYDLLPRSLAHLKPVGRLDKDSSGLLLITTDGQLANRMTHPRYEKQKIYEVTLDKPLAPPDKRKIEQGVKLDDGPSRLHFLTSPQPLTAVNYRVAISEGRTRQIRRTFAALGYKVIKLHRTDFGDYKLPQSLQPGGWQHIESQKL